MRPLHCPSIKCHKQTAMTKAIIEIDLSESLSTEDLDAVLKTSQTTGLPVNQAITRLIKEGLRAFREERDALKPTPNPEAA